MKRMLPGSLDESYYDKVITSRFVILVFVGLWEELLR